MNTKNGSSSLAAAIAMQHYFDDLEEQIVQKLHQEAMTEEGRSELITSTGVKDPELTDELVKLGITADGLIALRLFPLVLVAWAEGIADKDERDAVMAEAMRLGVRQDTTSWILLDRWLKKRPPGLGVDAWRRYTHNIFSEMSDVAIDRLIKLTQKQMSSVAKASGGHLRFGKISKKEHILIDRLLATMQQHSSAS